MNKIPDKVTVCLTDRGLGFSTDAELPVNMPADKLRAGILRLLREFKPELYRNVSYIELSCGDIRISGRNTLASLGIWDGSTIVLRSS